MIIIVAVNIIVPIPEMIARLSSNITIVARLPIQEMASDSLGSIFFAYYRVAIRVVRVRLAEVSSVSSLPSCEGVNATRCWPYLLRCKGCHRLATP